MSQAKRRGTGTKSTRTKKSYARIMKDFFARPIGAVRFDYDEEGYLGINQDGDHGTVDRVLLSPGQVAALKAFTRRRPTVTR